MTAVGMSKKLIRCVTFDKLDIRLKRHLKVSNIL